MTGQRAIWQTSAPVTEPVALVVLNMGGPDSLEAVEPFLVNLFSDRELIRLPGGAWLQKPLARLLARRRAAKVREHYRAMGGASPLGHWTDCQGRAIARQLGLGWRPQVVMRYWRPRAAQALARLQAEGVRRAMVLPLYPHYSAATTGSSIRDFARAAAEHYPELEYRIIAEWHAWAPFLDTLADRVREGLRRFPAAVRDEVALVFSAHALPQRMVERGDPYLRQVQTTVRGVLERLEGRGGELAFQSRSGPVRWVGPGIIETLNRLNREGFRAVLMVPVSFVSDHIETLHEIDHGYRNYALGHGWRYFERTAMFNDHEAFARAMAALVAERLPDEWRSGTQGLKGVNPG